MSRPVIICHMVTSLDGKVTGDFLTHPACEAATKVYYDINRRAGADGFICGRITMEGSFTNGWYPDLSGYMPKAKTDFVPADCAGPYAVAFDTNGRLGWQTNRIVDDDPGYGGSRIVEVVSEQVDPRYLGYLETLGIPYLFAGKDAIDVPTALCKLNTLPGTGTLLLEGGSRINGAFLRADAIDELSLVVAPIAADADDKPLFTDSRATAFELIRTTQQDGVPVLHYRRK